MHGIIGSKTAQFTRSPMNVSIYYIEVIYIVSYEIMTIGYKDKKKFFDILHAIVLVSY